MRPIAVCVGALGLLQWHFGLRTKGLANLLRANRAANGALFRKQLSRLLPGAHAQLQALTSANVSQREALYRTIVLAHPDRTSDGLRRGVVLIAFTSTSGFFHREIDLQRFTRDYRIVLEPSSSGYADADILAWVKIAEPVVVQSSEPRDRALLQSLNTQIYPVDFGASDWVDHTRFHELHMPKQFDVVYIANLNAVKRVHAFLLALARARRQRPSLRALLVLSSWGEMPRRDVDDMLAALALNPCVEIRVDLTMAQVNDAYNAAKCSVLLSYKEGSSRVLFESMFAGTPVILLRRNIGVNKDYINPHSGMLIEEWELATAILEMADRWTEFRPRQWALENISPQQTTAKLAKVLDALFPAEPSLADALAVKTNCPELRYWNGREPPHESTLKLFEQYARR